MVIDRKDMYVYMMRSLRKESGSPNLINHRPNSLKLLGLLHVDSNAHVKVGNFDLHVNSTYQPGPPFDFMHKIMIALVH